MDRAYVFRKGLLFCHVPPFFGSSYFEAALLQLHFHFQISHLRMQPRFRGDDMESRERRTSTFRLKRTYNYKPKETAIPVPMYLYKPMPEFRKER